MCLGTKMLLNCEWSQNVQFLLLFIENLLPQSSSRALLLLPLRRRRRRSPTAAGLFQVAWRNGDKLATTINWREESHYLARHWAACGTLLALLGRN